MKKVQRLIDEEARASEENRDAPLSPATKVSRPNRTRSTVYSIRLDADEVAALHELAESAGLPTSTLVRSWIIERIRSEHGDSGDPAIELRAAQVHLDHLKRHLSKKVS